MTIVNVYEAKTHLSRLLRRVRAGEEIVIADAGTPIARLVPLAPATGPRVLGGDEGAVEIADEFNAPLPPDVIADFWGGETAPPRMPPRPRRRAKRATR